MPTITIEFDDRSGPEKYLADLERRLQDLNVTRAELAAAAGLERSQISRWFNTPEQDIRLSNMLRLERALAAILRERQKKRTK